MTGKAAGARSTSGRAAASKPERKVDPDVVFVDLNDMTAAEFEAVEELSGLPVARTFDVEKPQGSISRAMAWAVRVRTDPDFPFEVEDCGRGQRPRCSDCRCSRRLKFMLQLSAPPVPPSGENG